MSDPLLLDVRDLSVHFPVRQGRQGRRGTQDVIRAVDGVDFQVYRAETLGLVGESGSGKTTVGRAVLRALAPTGGAIVYHFPGEPAVDVATLDKRALRPFRRKMQMVFQDPYSSLNPRMTVRDIIAEPLEAIKLGTRAEIDARVQEIARACRLSPDHLRRFPHAFSGGQRQRIGIARALASNPAFVVCDEPVSALDVSIRAEILNLLQDMQDQLGLTYLLVSHDLSVIEHVTHRVAVMYLGRLVELAPTKRVFQQPLHPYTETLLSAVPVADPEVPFHPTLLSGELPNPINPPSGCAFHTRCPYVEEVCITTRPELRPLAPGRMVACHVAHQLQLRGVDGGMDSGRTGQP